MKGKISFDAIREEVTLIQRDIPALKPDATFVLWFLRAFLADSHEAAQSALTGASRDKGIDAVLIDIKAKQVHIIQGKFHQSLGGKTEKRNDVLAFIDIADSLRVVDSVHQSFFSKLDPLTKEKLSEASSCLRKSNYLLHLYYVTTAKCSDVVKIEAKSKLRKTKGENELSIIDAQKVAVIFRDYIEGVAPAVPTMALKMSSESTASTDGCIHRFEPDTKIESWVFSMTAKDVGEMYAKAGIRLFARNVRGYLGESTSINAAMAKTVINEPRRFWYYNNGVTLVCDEAEETTQQGQRVLRVESPQIINGQQTTRTLCDSKSERASLLVKVIKIPRAKGDDDHYHDLISNVVRATTGRMQ